MQGQIGFGGKLEVRKISPPGPGLRWKLRNTLRWTFLFGLVVNWLAWLFTQLTGIPTITAELRARLFRADGTVIDYGIVSRRVVTDAGVAYLVDDWDGGGSDINLLDFHGCGTGTNAEDAGDTALQTESTTALNPDNTRATGTNSQPAANQFRTIGTLTFDASAAVTEHGIFSQAATGGGTLWDRSVFAAINVVSGDSIQFTYTCTINSGG
jgi:hypothetical protein